MIETAAISLTNRCNLSCSHCGSSDIYSGGGSGPEIDRTALRKLFIQLRELGASTVILSGGEPLLRKDLFSIIGDLGKTGLPCALATNGTLLTRRIIGRLKATGVVTFVRLSVEFPGKTPAGSSFHDADRVFRTLREVVDCGIAVGINMTLLPGNLHHTAELAGKSREAGASFFRAVPVLPVGRSAGIRLPRPFFSNCIAAMLSVKAEFTRVNILDSDSTENRLLQAGDRFVGACFGGSRVLSITADGRAHICAMTDLGGSGVYVTERPVRDCIRILTRRRAYLQRKILMSYGSACRDCRMADTCRGGCLAEWAARGGSGGQPCCYRKCWREAIGRFRDDKRIMSVAAGVVDGYEKYLLFNLPVPCLRALPIWTVEL